MATAGPDPLRAMGLPRPFHDQPPGKALLGMEEAERAGPFAEAFADVGLIPSLAFTAPQVLVDLDADGFDLVAVDVDLAEDRPETFLRAVHARTDAALLALGGDDLPLEKLFSAGIHGQVPRETPPQEAAMRGASLLGLRHLPETTAVLRWSGLELDIGMRQARWGSRPIGLTPLELRIVAALALARGRVVTVRDLCRLVWGASLPEDRERVAIHIHRIRRKIEPNPARPQVLLTVRGEGFRLAGGESGARDVTTASRRVQESLATGVSRPRAHGPQVAAAR